MPHFEERLIGERVIREMQEASEAAKMNAVVDPCQDQKPWPIPFPPCPSLDAFFRHEVRCLKCGGEASVKRYPFCYPCDP